MLELCCCGFGFAVLFDDCKGIHILAGVGVGFCYCVQGKGLCHGELRLGNSVFLMACYCIKCVCISAREKICKPLLIVWMDVRVAYIVYEHVPWNCVAGLSNVNGAYQCVWAGFFLFMPCG